MALKHDRTPRQWRAYDRWHWIIALLLVLLLIFLWFTGRGPHSQSCCNAGLPMTIAPTPAPAPEAAAPAETPPPATAAPSEEPAAAPPMEVPAVAKLYFEVNRTRLPSDAHDTLAAVIAYLKATPTAKAVISGYHDPTGNQAHNDELAKERAKSVREALMAGGIPEDRITLEKPRETTGSGDLTEARRVEVSVQ